MERITRIAQDHTPRPTHSVAEARKLRPTQLIAEALIDGKNPDELISRARQLGFSQDLTRAVVAVCCKDEQDRNTGVLAASSRP